MNITSLTQDHRQLKTTAALWWRALVSCSAFTFLRFHLFTWISISFTSNLRVNNFVFFTQDHSQLKTTAPLKWRTLVSCCVLTFFLFSLFLFTKISILFTSILRVNITSLTQDHRQLKITAPLRWRALVSCSAFTFLRFHLFTWISISFASNLRVNNWVFLLRTTVNSRLQHHYDEELW